MANQRVHLFASGKQVYYIEGKRFCNDKNKRNGKEKAEAYCLDNDLDTNDIIRFDSDTECDYYELLLERQKRGEISGLRHHYLLRLQDTFINANGDEIPEITYNADFIYQDLTNGRKMVVDVKSSEYFLNNDGGRFILLKSMFDKIFLSKGYYIQIIIKRGKADFYEWHIGNKQKSGKLINKQREQIKKLKAEKHKNEIEENKKQREIARLQELRALKINNQITKPQLKRLAELEDRYKI